jgi:solute carrier family 26, other
MQMSDLGHDDLLYEPNYEVRRPVYSLSKFELEFQDNRPPRMPYVQLSAERIRQSMYSKKDWKRRVYTFFPLIFQFKTFYKTSYIFWDVVAGLTMAMFYIPQGMAYGKVAGLEPINGLYSAFFIPIIYAVFGTSRQISVGTFSIMCLMMAGPVERLVKLHEPFVPIQPVNFTNTTIGPSSNKDEQIFRVQVAVVVTLISGLVQVIMGIFHLGFLATYFSDALVNGFSCGAAFHVLAAQWPNILGYSIGSHVGMFRLFYIYFDIFSKISQINWASVIISIICMSILVVFKEVINPRVKKRFNCPIPIEIILLIAITLIQKYGKLAEKFNVHIVGDVPQGLPIPEVPQLARFFKEVYLDAFAMAIVGFAISASLCKLFCLRFHYSVDFDQELLAMGLANCFGSFFKCHTGAGGMARSVVVADVGMKSQLATIVSCSIIFAVLMWIGKFFGDVPTCVLSAIICIALKELLFKLRDTRKLWKISSFDLMVWMISFLSTVFLDVLPGLMIGFTFSLLTIIFRTQRPACRVLGRLPNTDIYEDVRDYPQAVEISGIKIIRFDCSLYFANADYFEDTVMEMTNFDSLSDLLESEPAMEESLTIITSMQQAHFSEQGLIDGRVLKEPLQYVILDCSTWAYVDSVGVRALKNVLKRFSDRGVRVLLAVCKSNVREMFLRCDVYEQKSVGKDDIFLTVHDAVLSASANTQIST